MICVNMLSFVCVAKIEISLNYLGGKTLTTVTVEDRHTGAVY